jgi:hypothetical protein
VKRRLVLLVASVWLAACGSIATESAPMVSEPQNTTDERPRQTAVAPSTSPPADTPSPPPAPAAYAPDANEVHPEAKRVAAGVAHTLTNYGPETEFASAVAKVTSDSERQAVLTEAAQLLSSAGEWSRGRIVYPQLGGITPSRASVMVVVEQRTGTADQVDQTVTRTMDIRPRRVGRDWVFDEVASVGGTPIDRPADLPALAAAVVDNPRISLPDSARWDICRGKISTALLRLMTALADRTPYAVVMLSSGHPYHVFGTRPAEQSYEGSRVRHLCLRRQARRR